MRSDIAWDPFVPRGDGKRSIPGGSAALPRFRRPAGSLDKPRLSNERPTAPPRGPPLGTAASIAGKRATRDRILDAAERLFAERGFDGTSLRAITSAAGVNLAAVHYHLGSKEALLAAVVARHAEPVNRERLARLAALEAGGGELAVEDILMAFLAPALERGRRDPELGDVIVLVQGEPIERAAPLFRAQFGEVMQRFGDALGAALPELSPDVVRQRLHYAVGVLLHALSGRTRAVFDGAAGVDDDRPECLAAFLAAGFRAPVAGKGRSAP